MDKSPKHYGAKEVRYNKYMLYDSQKSLEKHFEIVEQTKVVNNDCNQASAYLG